MDRGENIIEGLKKNRQEAVASLYDTYAPQLLSTAMRYCGNREDAEDVLHDGFIKIIRKIGTFRSASGGSFAGWIHRIIVNTALNHLRDNAKTRMLSDISEIPDHAEDQDDTESTSDILTLGVSQESLMEMICNLPQGYRTVFNLFVFEEYSHRDIAQLLGCSESTSKTQLFKARALLKKQLADLAVTKEIHS